jgi:hypothetical protein
MVNMNNRLFFIAFATIAIASCTNIIEQPEQLGTQVTIKAYQEGAEGTKTTVIDGGTKVYWEPGEEISVFFRGQGSKFTSNNTETTGVAEFTGTINSLIGFSEGEEAFNCIWGLYPYDENATSDGTSLTTTVSSQQTGKAGSFASGTNITLACSKSYDLSFYNVLGGLRFSLVHEGIDKVTLESLNGEPLAGKIQLAFEGGVPAVQSVSNAGSMITLNPPRGEVFQLGEWYYICALPGTFEGVKLTFHKGTISASVTRENVSIKRGVFGSLAEADSGLSLGIQTQIQYRSRNNQIADLLTSSEWYSSISSHTYDKEADLGTICFDSEQKTYYKLFQSPGKITYLTIPEGITKIADGAFDGIGAEGYYTNVQSGAEIVSFAKPAPELGRHIWGGSYSSPSARLESFSYPDDADYLLWYYPNLNINGTTYYYDSWNEGLSYYKNKIGICPQVVICRGHFNSSSPSPTVTEGWGGEYLGSIRFEDSDENECAMFAFDRVIKKVPDKAFYYWREAYYPSFIFSEKVSSIGERAFEGANLSKLPRMRGVNTIGDYAFAVESNQHYTYSTIDLPPSVNRIGQNAFRNSTAKKICIYSAKPAIEGNSFSGIADGGTMYYPLGSSGFSGAGLTNWNYVVRDPSIVPSSMSSGIYIRTTSTQVTIEFSCGDGDYVDNCSLYYDGMSLFEMDPVYDNYVSHRSINVDCSVGQYVMVCFYANCNTSIDKITGADVVGLREYGSETFCFHYGGDSSSLRFEFHQDDEFFNNRFVWL